MELKFYFKVKFEFLFCKQPLADWFLFSARYHHLNLYSIDVLSQVQNMIFRTKLVCLGRGSPQSPARISYLEFFKNFYKFHLQKKLNGVYFSVPFLQKKSENEFILSLNPKDIILHHQSVRSQGQNQLYISSNHILS